MKKNYKFFSTWLLGSLCFLLLFSSSCAKVFIPTNHHHLVSPSHKGSLQLAGSIYDTYIRGEERDYPFPLRRYAYGAQLGYSPIEGLGLIANYYHPSYTGFVEGEVPEGVSTTTSLFVEEQRSTMLGYVGYMADIAVGKYWKRATRSVSRKGIYKVLLNEEQEWLFDFYGGIGRGKISGDYLFRGSRDFSFNECYLQGGVHLIWVNGYSSIDLIERVTGTSFKSMTFG